MLNPANTIAGIAREVSSFPCVSYLDDVAMSDGLLCGSIGSAAVVACSDMGWLVPYVCSSRDVQLNLFQNFGHSFATGGLVENIVGQGIEHVVIYGHTPCQYTKYLAEQTVQRSNVDANVDEGLLKLYAKFLESENPDISEEVGQYQVLAELGKMLADSSLAPMVSNGKLKVHGWFYKTAERQLTVFDPGRQAFIVPETRLKNSAVMKFIPDESHVGED